MKPTGSGREDNHRRRPLPWPRSVEIMALLVAGCVILWYFYYLLGDLGEDAALLRALLEQRRDLAPELGQQGAQAVEQFGLLAEQQVGPAEQLDQRSALGLEAAGG